MDIFLGVGALLAIMKIGSAVLSLACRALSFSRELMMYREAAANRRKKTD